MRTLLKRLAPLALALGVLLLQTAPALACGGLVAPNGAVRLERATTLVAWHGGVEHYMTTFTYQGDVSNLGWIVPLPAIPTKIEEGGAWTLQRLFRETRPQPREAVFAGAAASADSAQVIQQVQVEALDITVLKGSGQAVLDWCAANGFAVDGETRAHLLAYAKASPIFMAAKFDVSRAQARHQLQGDGAPVLITMPTPQLWVPLEVLALDGQQVQADLYLLTDSAVNTSEANAAIGQSAVGSAIPGATGFTVQFQEKMTPTLYHDLSTDRNMGWVRPDSWLTYLSLDAPDSTVTYDLGLTSHGIVTLAPFGTAPDDIAQNVRPQGLAAHVPWLPLGTPDVLRWWAVVQCLALVAAGLVLLARAYARGPE